MTLDCAVEQAILGGAALTSIGADGPNFGDVELWRRPSGSVDGCATLTFSGGVGFTARLHYGLDLPEAGLRTTHILGGDALYDVGQRAAHGPPLAHSVAQAVSLAAGDLSASLTPSGVVH